MATYKITDPETGKTIRLTGDSPPTEQELNEVFNLVREQNQGSQSSDRPIGQKIGQKIANYGLRNLSPLIFTAGKVMQDPRGNAEKALEALPVMGAIGAPMAVTLPTAGAGIAAGALMSGAGAAGGEALRQMGRKALGLESAPPLKVPLPFIDKDIPEIPGVGPNVSNIIQHGIMGAGSEFAGQGIASLAKGTSKLLKSASIGSARRALGNLKSNLTSTKSWRDGLRKQAQANQAAATMLAKNAISKTGSTTKTFENIQKLQGNTGKEMSKILETADNAGGSIDTADFALEMEKALKPKYADEIVEYNKILDDLSVNGDQLSLFEAKLNIKPSMGKAFDKPMTSRAVNFTRRAAKFLENKIANRIRETLGKESSKAYASANSLYGKTQNALQSILPQKALEMGNQVPSLGSTALAAGRLAAGDIPGALASAGGLELLKRRGAGVLANAFKKGADVTRRITPERVVPPLKTLGGILTQRRKEKK